jgi:2,4-dienoyl-CoA reductase-like NADH-dependent reductase (Old Yellow Enzyme family)
MASSLFTPFSYGKLHLANRIVMAPMTRSRSPHGVPGEDVAAYYKRRAAQDVGLIMSEGTLIGRPEAGSDPNVPYFNGEKSLAGWARVIEGVHAAGGKMMPQLWHVGMQRAPGHGANPEAAPLGPSGLNLAGEKVNEEPSTKEVEAIIAAYAEAAGDAKRLGFDGLELHGAHGYLIDQFFWERTNRRTDRFGGDLVARTRFASEVIEACRAAVGPDFPIVLRFSQWKLNNYDARLVESPQQLEQFLAPLAAAGVDIFHCSQRRFWEPEFSGSALNLAGWTKKLTGRPVITVGAVGLDGDFIQTFSQGGELQPARLDRLEEMLAKGEVDLVAVGRALLADPSWAAKVRTGQAAVPFHSDALGVYI